MSDKQKAINILLDVVEELMPNIPTEKADKIHGLLNKVTEILALTEEN